MPKQGDAGDPGLPPPTPQLAQTPETICFLDADIMIFRNMDDIFDVPLPSSDWIAAHHACICNVDRDPWAPKDWTPENCPTTSVSHPEALLANIPNTIAQGARPTYLMLNSGVFVCKPSQELWQRINDFLHTDERVKTFVFPDQNFLDAFFENRWVPIGWQYNAFKTHRYWHSAAWRDDEVWALHYIVDKPWEHPLTYDGDGKPVGGHRGRDGETHSWWWKAYDEWRQAMLETGDAGKQVLDTVTKHLYVDSKLGETRFKK
jgi:lipopolysaccharide biosynthesis glycosyltransferase